MNRFCTVLTVLFSINLTTSDFVSADDRAHRNGIKFYRDAMQKLKAQEKRSAADDLFKQAIKSLEAALKGIKAPKPKAVVHLCLGISKYEYRRGSKKEAAESLKLALEGNWLDTEQRADAHLYLAMSLLALGEKTARENFEKAFRQNPNIEFPSWRKDDTEAVKEFNKVQKAVTGILTVTLSPPEAKNWTISIDGKKLYGKNRNAVVSQDGLRLYKKDEYKVQGIYKGESIEETVTIEPNRHNRLVLEIPPLTVEHKPPSSVDAGKEIPLTIYVSRNEPRQVNIYYRKTSEWRFTSKRSDNLPVRSADGWAYTVNLPSQDFVGKIEYYIEAEYADPPPVKHPENDYHQISIVDNTPPTIRLIEPKKNEFKVNEKITIEAKVTDDTSVKQVRLFYGFSEFNRLVEPSQYNQEDLTGISSDRYTGYIPAQSQAGYIWYYLTATDGINPDESEKRGLKITEESSPIDNTPPTIRLIEPKKNEFKVNEKITIEAKVTDDTSVKQVRLFYGFSEFNRLVEPSQYNQEDLTGISSDRYTGYIPAQSQAGYIWYYLTATDGINPDESEKRGLKIVESPEDQDDEPSPEDQDDEPSPEDEQPPDEKQEITVAEEPEGHEHRIWINYTLSDDFFKDVASVLDWDRGDVLNLAYLVEFKTHWRLGAQLDVSYQNPAKYDNSLLMRKVLNASLTVQGGYAFGESSIMTVMALGGVAGYWSSDSDLTDKGRSTPTLARNASDESTHIAPILGASLKYYLWGRVTIDATGSIKPLSFYDALVDVESISDIFTTHYLYHYEAGIRFDITPKWNLRAGYGKWYLGDRSTTGIQIGGGFKF